MSAAALMTNSRIWKEASLRRGSVVDRLTSPASFSYPPILVGVAGNLLHLLQIRASPPLHGRPAEQGLRLELAGEHDGYVPMIHPYTFRQWRQSQPGARNDAYGPEPGPHA
jgi:hypothetical protein